MSNLVRFEKVDNELNILRIGGKSFLPPDVEWPTNPNYHTRKNGFYF